MFLRVEGEKSHGISITATDLSHVANPLEFDKGARTTAVVHRYITDEESCVVADILGVVRLPVGCSKLG